MPEYKNKWLCSYETILFDTLDGDIDVGQYALDEDKVGYYIRTRPKTEAQFDWVPLVDDNGVEYDVSKLTEVKIAKGHAYYDEFLTAAGATNLWTATSIHAGKGPSQLPSGSVLRVQSNAKKYWDTAQIKGHPQPTRVEMVEILPPPEPLAEVSMHHSIEFDATSYSDSTGAVSSYSFNHTCGASADLLVFGNGHYKSSGDITISSVTYNSVAMTLARDDVKSVSGWNFRSAVYYLLAPGTGSAYTVAITYSGTTTNGDGGVVSYSGARQTGQPDAVNGATGSASKTASTIVTTVADNCWVFSAVMFDSYPATSGNTVRWSGFMFGSGSDTNGPKTPAGNQTMSWTIAINSIWAISAASFAPAERNPRHGFIMFQDPGIL